MRRHLFLLFLLPHLISLQIEADSITHDTPAEANAALGGAVKKRSSEDAIPVIEIKGEGKPMTSAQIRELEEITNGGPLDVKIEKTWVPGECPRAARRLDFITFHYKGFSETGKKFEQTYGRLPDGIRIQLGVGMVIPGLEKGLAGMCDQELRKIEVPHRLSRKRKSRVWKNIPNDEHWLSFSVEMMSVEEWTLSKQFSFLDLNNDTQLTQAELVKWVERMRKDFGKTWSNEDIDDVLAARYYIKYFDADGDGRVREEEFSAVMRRDMALMEQARKERRKGKGKNKKGEGEGRKRDPGLAWILDFNNDGLVSVQEMDEADQIIQHAPKLLPGGATNSTMIKEEL